jgi:hypothetical protein
MISAMNFCPWISWNCSRITYFLANRVKSQTLPSSWNQTESNEYCYDFVKVMEASHYLFITEIKQINWSGKCWVIMFLYILNLSWYLESLKLFWNMILFLTYYLWGRGCSFRYFYLPPWIVTFPKVKESMQEFFQLLSVHISVTYLFDCGINRKISI